VTCAAVIYIWLAFVFILAMAGFLIVMGFFKVSSYFYLQRFGVKKFTFAMKSKIAAQAEKERLNEED
jgi:hypothetical protein